jgi:hypothetical protein
MREATIRLSEEQLGSLGLTEVVGAARTAGLQDVTELVCRGPGSVFHISVDEPLPEAELNDCPSLDWFERLALGGPTSTYLCKVEPRGQNEQPDCAAPAEGDDLAGEGSGLAIAVLGSRGAIGRSIAATDDPTPGPLLERLAEVPASGRGTGEPLTERQMEVVRTAHSMGYYEVPRRSSTAEIADAVGLDGSTVSEHLQRAERNIVEDLLGRDG